MRPRIPALALALLAAAPPPAAAATWIEGVVIHVRDGDTIVIDGRVVRLFGLHAGTARARRGGGAALDDRAGAGPAAGVPPRRAAQPRPARGHVLQRRRRPGGATDRRRIGPRLSALQFGPLRRRRNRGRRLALPAYCLPRDTGR
jgi:hypothetical protein